jgi:RimJ/RimL family protein N-acetyltransferase
MEGVDATVADGADLAAFACTSNNEDWELEVEGYVRTSLFWRSRRAGRYVKVFRADDGGLAAVVGYESADPRFPEHGFWVSFLAVTIDRQRYGLGRRIILSVIAELGRQAPMAPIGWLVHEHNEGSRKMCDRLVPQGYSLPLDAPGYLEYKVIAPPAL